MCNAILLVAEKIIPKLFGFLSGNKTLYIIVINVNFFFIFISYCGCRYFFFFIFQKFFFFFVCIYALVHKFFHPNVLSVSLTTIDVTII